MFSLMESRVITGDCIQEMRSLPEESIEAVVTDPPYGLAFMGNDWDAFDPREYQEFSREWAEEAFRVLKPGGHLIAFSGDRTHHRLFVGVEDAGFEIRSTLNWLFGNGMPKAPRVTLSMDDEDDVEEWSGFRPSIKPSAEYAVLARKPFDGPTYENVLEHGTGVLNIDEARIPIGDGDEWDGKDEDEEREQGKPGEVFGRPDSGNSGDGLNTKTRSASHSEGRYPANTIIDEEVAVQIDDQSGEINSGNYPGRSAGAADEKLYGDGKVGGSGDSDALDSGGASRFFYCSKATTDERTHNGKVENPHPTVKPLDVMDWLVRLVTREGDTVLDPFGGSGTTALACRGAGRNYVLIERDPDYVNVIEERLENSGELLQGSLSQYFSP